MDFNLEISMDNDMILLAAQETLAQQEDIRSLSAELQEQIQLAETTVTLLRGDIRQLVAEYRIWRREARCGRVVDNMQPINLQLAKRIRAAFATYRLTQLLMRDMRAMAGFNAIRPVAVAKPKMQASMPSITPVTETPQPANDIPAVDHNTSDDDITYEELEMRYGPSLAQKLFDEIKKQNDVDSGQKSARAQHLDS